MYPVVGKKVSSILSNKCRGSITSKVQMMCLKRMSYQYSLNLQERDAAYLGAIIDGEGSVDINKAISGKGKSYFQPKISINNSDLRLIEWVSKVLSGLRLHYAKEKPAGCKIVYHAVIVGSAPVYAILVAIHHFLLVKKDRASLVLEYTGSRIGKPKYQPYTERQYEIYGMLREMHRKGV